MQIEPAPAVLVIHLQMVDVLVGRRGKAGQQVSPGIGQTVQRHADGIPGAHPGHHLHGQIPDGHGAQFVDGADPQGQVEQHLSMVASQVVEVGTEPAQAGAGVFQLVLDEAHGVGQRALGVDVELQAAVDDHVGQLGAEQARKIALDALAQPPELGGTGLARRETQIPQCLLDLPLRGFAAQHLRQLFGELGRRAGIDHAAERDQGLAAAGVGRLLLAAALFAQQ